MVVLLIPTFQRLLRLSDMQSSRIVFLSESILLWLHDVLFDGHKAMAQSPTQRSTPNPLVIQALNQKKTAQQAGLKRKSLKTLLFFAGLNMALKPLASGLDLRNPQTKSKGPSGSVEYSCRPVSWERPPKVGWSRVTAEFQVSIPGRFSQGRHSWALKEIRWDQQMWRNVENDGWFVQVVKI